jgi:hypothetical protein
MLQTPDEKSDAKSSAAPLLIWLARGSKMLVSLQVGTYAGVA